MNAPLRQHGPTAGATGRAARSRIMEWQNFVKGWLTRRIRIEAIRTTALSKCPLLRFHARHGGNPAARLIRL
jgi:hypothetical protein